MPPIALRKFVATDTETTDLDPGTGRVISVAAAIIDLAMATEDDPFPIVDRFESGLIATPVHEFFDKLTENDIKRGRTKTAADVNGVTREQIAAGVAPEKAWGDFVGFLSKHTFTDEAGKVHKPTPFGQNLKFDRGFIAHELGLLGLLEPGNGRLDKYIDYHDLDLMSLCAFEMLLGLPGAPNRMNLVAQTKAFGVPHKAHDAMGDVEAACELMRRRIKRAHEGWYKPV